MSSGWTGRKEFKSHNTNTSPSGAVDMAGNVWEWVNDRYGKNYYRNAPEKNPRGPDARSLRGIREGSWNNSRTSGGFRAADRNRFIPGIGIGSIGFRCAKASG